MAFSDLKAVDAQHNGKKVRGIYQKELGAFEMKKGAVKITVPEYEYSFDFTVAGKRYRSVFGRESEHGKIGARGKWESNAVENAVEALQRFKANALSGEGPTSLREEQELSRRQAEDKKRREAREKTVEQLIELFLEDISRTGENIKTRKPRTIKEYKLNLNRDVVPAIGKRKAKDIEREDIADILEKIVKRGKIVQANRTLAACSRLFNWALSKGRVRYNPCSMMEKYEEAPRKRVLTEPEKKDSENEQREHKEIKVLWEKLIEHQDRPEAKILLVCFMTGARPGEVCQMRWEDIEENGWWSLHSDDTKTGETLEVYLTKTVREIIGEKPKGGSEFVFPLLTDDKRHIAEARLSKFVREYHNYFGLEPWQPRDIRRTYTTLAKELGFSDVILNKAQTRKDSSVIRKHYDKRRYYEELRQLSEAIEREMLRIIGQPLEPAKVYQLKA